MKRELYRRSILKGLEWIEKNMLTVYDGYNGMYERIRIDKKIRTNWVRPDGNAELAKLLTCAGTFGYEKEAAKRYETTVLWLQRAQDDYNKSAWYGSFPFFLIDGYDDRHENSQVRFQNDNGKILLYMVQIYDRNKDKRMLEMAKKLADYWTAIQWEEGYFFREDGKTFKLFKGPCFVLWLAAGLLLLGNRIGESRYTEAAKRALMYTVGLITEKDRMTTSYELDKTEDWRPASSESAIALYVFSLAYRETGEAVYKEAAQRVASYVLKLQDECGAIVNCLPEEVGKGSDLQTTPELCDLVYTQGFALMAFAEAFRTLKEDRFWEAAEKLADFLVSVQCSEEGPVLNGSWRGSYNVKTREWDGRADQNNPIDEGGKYSAYTGWCTIPIMQGLAMLLEIE
ncbi:MAG: hypothetical protein K2P50_10495 [Lachnospiraceae bacterium]|nr:hypothetical protein [Lachnospiraceae bacterium]